MAQFAGSEGARADGRLRRRCERGAHDVLIVWSVAIPVVVLERPGGLSALTRSSDLVRGHRWKVLVLAVLFWLTATVGVRALGLAGHTGLGVAVQLIAAILIAPIPLLAATALYFELRQSAATDMPRTGHIATCSAGRRHTSQHRLTEGQRSLSCKK